MEITESFTNIIAETTTIEGRTVLQDVSRVHGVLKGEVIAPAGSLLTLGETARVEGVLRADSVVIDGFVEGEVFARTRVVISGTGRVIGTIECPVLVIEPGAWFEGSAKMEALTKAARAGELAGA